MKMTMQTLTYDELTFEHRESAQRATLEIIVDRDGSLVLATPPDVPREELEAFIEEHLIWVYTKLEEKAGQARPRARKEYVPGEGFFYLGRSYRLRLVNGAQQRPPLRFHRGWFELRRDLALEGREQFIAWYTAHLRPVLERTLDRFVDRIDATPGPIHIQDMGYRWGSTDRRGHLYFHWRVAMLPFRMIEYVVAHELTHLIEPQHSDAFWMRLERLITDYEERRRWLEEEGALYDL
jgi:predicted metal-dependent hydrolase